jgi:hypothetical protein
MVCLDAIFHLEAGNTECGHWYHYSCFYDMNDHQLSNEPNGELVCGGSNEAGQPCAATIDRSAIPADRSNLAPGYSAFPHPSLAYIDSLELLASLPNEHVEEAALLRVSNSLDSDRAMKDKSNRYHCRR